MKARPQQVAPGVWVARGLRDHWRTAPIHPLDRTAAEGFGPYRAEEFLAGRALLRALLDAVYPQAAEDIVCTDPRGRPHLARTPDTGISVSHDGPELAVAAALGRRIGVDVQRPPHTVSQALLKRCLHDHAPRVMLSPKREHGMVLARVWTVQEACVKAAGTGLAGHPWNIDVAPDQLRGRWSGFEWVSLPAAQQAPLSCAYSTPVRCAEKEKTS
ncbi:4'-phosphopantetheinyl transferase superfamily protein [Streptomyces sp. TRM 70361]|uniref:4'-phosphopantetheinyl transferase family protein n=1 Tax=Streptomyces sp. TRM 70361 TaxID=3116553 RepID=UPI002E7BAB0E|nr:4'-phosphopantetheinyl transferase superfamily protein [Streptomyces sp. TRM 70361]MEE1943038.1 4'-phosphopantetheinyl transferase superfamily protein [Streptomyces sp. TRM 70361]